MSTTCQVCGRREGVGASGCLAWTGNELARRACRAAAEMPKREALTCPDDLHPAATIQDLRAQLASVTAEAFAAGRAAGRAEERAAVVAWLRTTPHARGVILNIGSAQTIARLAGGVETGEHVGGHDGDK